MAHLTLTLGATDYAVTARAGRHTLVADEPAERGGADAGPAPYELLLAALGACTAITLRMYAQRKQWAFRSLEMDLHYTKPGERGRIDRHVRIDGELTDEQRSRLAEIAEKTPVTLTLKTGVDIHTHLH